LYGLDSLPTAARGGVLTIGNFDGVHVGHMSIITRARQLADADGLTVMAMTFEPPPDLVIRPDDPPQRLTPPEQKARLLRQAGADWIVFVPTTRELLALQAEDFVRQIVLQFVAPRHVVEGHDFSFGRERAGNVDTLREIGLGEGFEVDVVEPVTVDLPGGRRQVCSTLVRRLVAEGQMEEASQCLGREFALYGEVVSGRGRGRSLGFPTANIEVHQQVIPARGIYAGLADVNKRTYASAISIGRPPTFPDANQTIEAHLIDVKEEWYGQPMVLRFVCQLRRQRQFGSAEALSAQIAKDVERVREICRKHV